MSGGGTDRDSVSLHRYPARAMSGDYLRSSAGLLFAVLALTQVPLDSTAGWMMVALGALCVTLAGRAGLRQITVLELSDEALRRGYLGLPMGATTLRWEELDDLRVKFFPTVRDRSKGWLQIVMRGGSTRVTIDSTLEDFDAVAEAAARAAEERDLELSITTMENLGALGIRTRLTGYRGPPDEGDQGAKR